MRMEAAWPTLANQQRNTRLQSMEQACRIGSRSVSNLFMRTARAGPPGKTGISVQYLASRSVYCVGLGPLVRRAKVTTSAPFGRKLGLAQPLEPDPGSPMLFRRVSAISAAITVFFIVICAVAVTTALVIGFFYKCAPNDQSCGDGVGWGMVILSPILIPMAMLLAGFGSVVTYLYVVRTKPD
jgi:hypothetical protein